MSVKDELDRLGSNIVKDARKNAEKNKKTGTLDRSLEYDTVVTNDNTFELIINEVYYGKYLNKKNGFMTRAIESNIESGIESIINVQIDELLKGKI